MTSKFSVDSIMPLRQRMKPYSRHSPPRKKSRLAAYETVKGGRVSDEADDEKKYMYQLAANRQGTNRSRLSFEILARLFPKLEFKTTTEQPVTRRGLQCFAKLNNDSWIAERRSPFVEMGKRAVRFNRIAVEKALSKFVVMEVA